MKKFTVTVLIMAGFFAAPALGDDWPQFKKTPGRQGNSPSETIPLPPKLCLWMDFGSPILSSPAAVGGNVYVLSADGLLARLDPSNQSVDWTVQLGGVNNESSPAVYNGRVYVGSTGGTFYTIDAVTGAVLNSLHTGSPIFASPLLLSTGIYFGNYGGTFHAVDFNGDPKWTFQAKGFLVNSAAGDSAGTHIIFPDGYHHLYCLSDQGTSYGVVFDVFPGDRYNLGYASAPMIWKDSVFIGAGDAEFWSNSHGLLAYSLNTGALLTPSALTFDLVVTPPSVDPVSGVKFIATATGGIYARGAGWSTTAYWASAPAGIYGVNSSPAVLSNCVIFGSEDGQAVHFFAKASSNYYGGTEMWSYKPASDKPISSAPAVSGGKVFIGSHDGGLYGFWNGTAVTAPTPVNGPTTERQAVPGTPGSWNLAVFPNPTLGHSITLSSGRPLAGTRARIYGIDGRLVRVLQQSRHSRNLKWDLRDGRGKPAGNGNFLVVMDSENGSATRTVRIQILR